MRPGSKARLRALKLSSPRYMKKLWLLLCGILFPILAVVFLLMSQTAHQKVIMILSLAGGMAFILAVAFLLIALVSKMLLSGIVIPDQVSQVRLSYDQLMQDALNIGDDSPWTAEIHPDEGWIDVTWKWKESIDLGTVSVSQNEEVFYKLFRIHDDFTYEDLDYTTSRTAALSAGGAGLSANYFLGHVQRKTYVANVGHNKDEGFGVHQYSLDTAALTNYMHQWFADRGYRYRGI